MYHIKSAADLKAYRHSLQEIIAQKANDPVHKNLVVIRVAMATCGIASGAKEVFRFFSEECEKRNIDAEVVPTGCMGFCYAEPTIEISKPGAEAVVFGFVDQRKADDIIEKYIKKGEFLEGIIPQNFETV